MFSRIHPSPLDAMPVPAVMIDPLQVGYPVLEVNEPLIQLLGRNPVGQPFSDIAHVDGLLVVTAARSLAAMSDWDQHITDMSSRALQRLFDGDPLPQVLNEILDTLAGFVPGTRLGLVMQYDPDAPLELISSRLPGGLRELILQKCRDHWSPGDQIMASAERIQPSEFGGPFGLPAVWGRSAFDASGRRVAFLVLYVPHYDAPTHIDMRTFSLAARLAVMLNGIDKFRQRFEETNAALAERMSGEMTRRFLRATGHDLRQPLQALESGIDLLREKVGAGGRDLIPMLSGAVVRTQEILDCLIDLVRIEEGDLSPRAEPFALTNILREAVRAHADIAASKGLTLQVEETDLWVSADPLMTLRMIECLVSNAVRYTPAGQVTVKARAEGSSVRIDIADTGLGIESSEVLELFAGKTTRKPLSPYQAGGVGLGLTLVRNLADLLNAEVAICSRRNAGTTFTITLPQGQAQGDGARWLPVSTLGRPAKVLFVDDDPQVLEVIRRLLSSRDLEVAAFADPYEALKALDWFEPDLLLTDYRMPQMSGLELAAAVRSRLGRALPSLIMTGDTSVAVRERNRRSRSHFIRKPVRSSDLVALIGEIMITP